MRMRDTRHARERGIGARARAGGWGVRGGRVGLVLAWAASALMWADAARAQESVRGEGWFPRTHYFLEPLADPREPQTSAGLIVTNLFDSEARERPPFSFPPRQDVVSEVQGAVGFAANVPVWGRGSPDGRGGLVIGLQAGVQARFRIEQPSRDKLGSDWTVAIPLEVGWQRASARVRLIHRSAHLGDELVASTGARRIEYSHEAVDALLGVPVAGGRAYAGGALIFRSNTEAEPALRSRQRRDNASIQAGYDGAWYPWAGGNLGPVAGFDWQRAQRTAWRDELGIVAGLGGRVAGYAFRLVARYYQGPSPLGQFFLTPERYWGLEFLADL